MRAVVLVGPERRRRWSVDEELRIVHEAFAPGVQIADMARRRDVSRAQIYQWRAALREGRLTGTDAVGFVPVEMAGPEPRPTDALTADLPVEIALACGRGLKVPSSLLTAGAAAVDPRGGERMIGPGTGVRIYLACGVTDMRKGITGLAAAAQQVLKQNPASGTVFAFRGRRGDRINTTGSYILFLERLGLATARTS